MTDQTSIDLGVQGVPQDAMRRLAELQPGRPGSIFTSDLSVNEFLLVREAGFRPLGLVLGSSIYHVGLQIGRWGSNQELDVLSQAMYHARELAMSRMEAEADALHAEIGGGVVSHRAPRCSQVVTGCFPVVAVIGGRRAAPARPGAAAGRGRGSRGCPARRRPPDRASG